MNLSALSESIVGTHIKTYVQPSQTTLTEEYHPVSSDREIKQQKKTSIIDASDQHKSTNTNLSTKRTRSYTKDEQEKQTLDTKVTSIPAQTRSAYDM